MKWRRKRKVVSSTTRRCAPPPPVPGTAVQIATNRSAQGGGIRGMYLQIPLPTGEGAAKRRVRGTRKRKYLNRCGTPHPGPLARATISRWENESGGVGHQEVARRAGSEATNCKAISLEPPFAGSASRSRSLRRAYSLLQAVTYFASIFRMVFSCFRSSAFNSG